MSPIPLSCWLVIQAKASKYADVEGAAYEYPRNIPNAQRIREGDVLVIAVPKEEAKDDKRVVGLGRVAKIGGKSEERRLAAYDRYLTLNKPASFEEIGGDPRTNQSNSINLIDASIVAKLLEREGFDGIDALPVVAQRRIVTVPRDHDMREQLHQAVVRDLLGPALGLDEEMYGTSVRDRYLVGKLAPKETLIEEGEVDDLSQGSDDGGDDGAPEPATLLSQSIVPSSFGLTFCVDANCDTLEVEAFWGHYRRLESETEVTASGKGRTVWKRRPGGGTKSISARPGQIEQFAPDAEQPNVLVRGVVRPATPEGDKIITLFLVNDQEATEKLQDEMWLFQSHLEVRGPDGAAVFRRRPSGEGGSPDAERAALSMLYRDKIEFAVGHGVSVHWTCAEGQNERATSVRTQVVPSHDVPVTEAPSAIDIPGFEHLKLDMKELAELDAPGLAKTLAVLENEYRAWIKAQQRRIDAGQIGEHGSSGRAALERCRAAADRLKVGIDTVVGDPKALDAFRFANRSMWHQRVRSLYALERRRGNVETKLEAFDIPKNRSWRPFQLAFVLIALPSLADPRHGDRTDAAAAIADLLWFPTGGGKTEAYLGVAAFAMAIRRLQGPLGGLDNGHGLTVVMRYTLRLLTIQQFQRATALMCAMEVLRREAAAKGDKRWGDTPFRIGLWVGQSATPNRTVDAQQAIQNARGNQWQQTGAGTPAQLGSCPWCGSEILPGRDVVVLPFAQNVGRTLSFCSDKIGVCEFSPAKAPSEGLPVVVVDEEIYRLLPALLIATVD